MVYWHLLIKRDVKNNGNDIKFKLDENLVATEDLDEYLIQRGDTLAAVNKQDLRGKSRKHGEDAMIKRPKDDINVFAFVRNPPPSFSIEQVRLVLFAKRGLVSLTLENALDFWPSPISG